MSVTPHRRPRLVVSLCLLVAAALLLPLPARSQEITAPFSDEFAPPDRLTWPITVLSLRGKLGKMVEGGQRVVAVLNVANGSDEDTKMFIDLTLVDRDGKDIATVSTKQGVEEGELTRFDVKFIVDPAVVPTIASYRAVVSAP